MNDIKEIIKAEKIVTILRNVPTLHLEKLLEILKEEKIKVLEIALNSNDIEEQFKILKKYENDFIIGAGTVTTKERLKFAIKNNVKFILTPNTDEEILKEVEKTNILCVCGFLTPSEAAIALKYKCCKILKLFPANEMPMTYLKALKGPLNNFDCMAVGGVSEKNMNEFFKRGFCSVGLGSSLIDNKLIKENKFEELREKIKNTKNILKNIEATKI
ncbi:bifunctional 4-hydroxy-2-oxoglutarate aldolase/2-dehydro-3-deoxy-phosphogluconate aldolase [Fusobacterium perfoetens]|uniref:bifunctional 4-hydroxy-2-oxoglutarate aldolase/2-dehydro-3-deoxy-phosphogluconate aldolase n=1 Tax=Fusobacterium perfoetens TaxID=852 RepID=UPI0006851611|nr:bifunctional 4-hydroxy-2-oxoglutarate aldolase/2-dehydro-3-deoxy-phosphogluconate aldolase [Fusobacterium perfoetens]MCI6152243.1 bifunctional 4-hydroxy-2-oxoglutarate aldolase/2-dehydro-3-deoxy-phosphogluconate aldolase [Fusobacterium perfoetens]MDY3237485.1 bifunctional 4-hydroxy-2-oxoglutarate aldolase/2-dehydro-3-deoxy-phosphogluconate aldolase [Fusobacterium perfoetens]